MTLTVYLWKKGFSKKMLFIKISFQEISSSFEQLLLNSLMYLLGRMISSQWGRSWAQTWPTTRALSGTLRMRRTSLFLQCACAQILYSCSAHSQLLFSCSAYAHNFSIPTVRLSTTSRSCSVHSHKTAPLFLLACVQSCSISFTCMRTNLFPSYINV